MTTAEGDPVEERRSTGGDVRGPGGFWVWVACAVGGLLIVGGVALVLSWQEYREQRRGAERVEVYALAVAVTARLTDERAALTGLLHDAPLPADLTGAGRARLRARTDAAITRLAAVLPRHGIANVETLRAGRAALAAIRRDIDDIVALPPGERDPGAVGDAISGLSAVLQRAANATAAVHVVRPGDLAMAMDDVATADLAGRVREHAGRLQAAALIRRAGGDATALPAVSEAAQERVRLAEYVRRIDFRVDPSVDDPRVNAAWERLNAAATAAGIGSAPTTAGSPTAAEGDLGDVVAAADPLRDVSLQIGVERAGERRDGARRLLVAVAAFVAVALAAAGLAAAIVRRRVVIPLLAARRQIMALADGDLPEPVGAPRGGPAVVALFDAVEVLRRSQERQLALERERAVLNEQLRLQARTDALTGLLNRHALETAARDLVADGVGEPGVGLIMCDLDRFKTINDRHGHLAGDAVLREVAARLRGRCDPGQLVARFGGEEFVVLVRGGRLDGVVALAEELRVAIADTPVPIGDGVVLDVTASFGVVAGRRDDGWGALVTSADAALYEAKQTGRNRVVARRHAEAGNTVPNR